MCIAVILLTALMPAVVGRSPASSALAWSAAPAPDPSAAPTHPPDVDLAIVLSLGLLLGAVVSVRLERPDEVDLPPAPFLSIRVTRGPPTA